MGVVMAKLWVAGMFRDLKQPIWELVGVFDSEQMAIDACIDYRYFIGPAVLNEATPFERMEWPGCYYPKSQLPALRA